MALHVRLPEIAVVGGGPGGLMLLHELERTLDRPCRAALFEADGRLGGKVWTRSFRSQPLRYEAGAAELYDVSAVDVDPLRELIADLRLPTTRLEGSAVVLEGRVIANLDDFEAAFGGAARRAVEAFDREARGRMSPRQFYDSDQAESFVDEREPGAFRALLQRVEDPAARRYLEVLMHSDLATEPEHTGLRYGLQNYLMNDPAYMSLYRIDGGNERLIDALAARIRAEVHRRHRLELVEALANGRVRLHFRHDGAAIARDFDHVVLALPLAALAEVRFEPRALCEAFARHSQQFHHPAHYLRVTALFDRPFWRATLRDTFWMLDAFEGCCVYDESPRLPSEAHGVLGWLLGGRAAVQLATMEDEALVQHALASLPDAFGQPRAHFIEAVVQRWIGAVSALPGGRRILGFDQRHRPAREVCPALYVVGDYLFDSTLNGVLESALHVATALAAAVADPVQRQPEPSRVQVPTSC